MYRRRNEEKTYNLENFVFFARAGGTGKVYHVGLYIGRGKRYSPNASSKVKIESISAGSYKKELLRR